MALVPWCSVRHCCAEYFFERVIIMIVAVDNSCGKGKENMLSVLLTLTSFTE
ncbi:MAG: hypothetical protein MSH60_11620 [Ruminococcus sp.]|nr:hypothetical protein [Ruminococcus sp.]